MVWLSALLNMITNLCCSYERSCLDFVWCIPTFEQTSDDHRCFIWYTRFITCSIATSSNPKCCLKLKQMFSQMSSALSFSSSIDKNGDLVDLDVIKKLDAIFDDFRIFVKITENCVMHKNFFVKMQKNLTGKTCKIGGQKEWNLLDLLDQTTINHITANSWNSSVVTSN